MPRSMSLAPSSRITASVPSGTDQSSRARPAGAGVAGHAGVGDLDGEALALERPFELHRKGRRAGKLIAGHQRIAERHQLDGPFGRIGPAGQPCQRKHDDRNRSRKPLDLTRRLPI